MNLIRNFMSGYRCFPELCSAPSSSPLWTLWSLPLRGDSGHPRAHGPQMHTWLPFGCYQAPHIQCVHKVTRLILSSDLFFMHGTAIYRSQASSVPPSPSLVPNIQSILSSTSQMPLSLSSSSLSGLDMAYLNYPIVFPLLPLPLGKSSSQPQCTRWLQPAAKNQRN